MPDALGEAAHQADQGVAVYPAVARALGLIPGLHQGVGQPAQDREVEVLARARGAALGDVQRSMMGAAAVLLQVQAERLEVVVDAGVVPRRAEQPEQGQGGDDPKGVGQALVLGAGLNLPRDAALDLGDGPVGAQQLLRQALQVGPFGTGAGLSEGLGGAVEEAFNDLRLEQGTARSPQQIMGRRALLRQGVRVAVRGHQTQQTDPIKANDPFGLRPVAGQLGCQAVVVALLFLPVEVEFGEQRLGVAPFRRQRLPRGAGALLVQPPDQVGGLGVVQTGDAIEDLGGIVDPLGGDPVDRQSQLAQGVAQAVAIGAAGLHHHLDADRRHQPAQPRHQQGGLLRMAPADDLNGFIPRQHPVRHEVGFGDIHREGDGAAARRLSQGCPIDLVDSRGLVSTLVHGDTSTLWVR